MTPSGGVINEPKELCVNHPRWLAMVILSSGLVLAGCTAVRPSPTSSGSPASPAISATASPTTVPSITVVSAPAPEVPSRAIVMLDAPHMVFSRPEDQPHAPETFVVTGDRITVADRVGKQIVTYQHGRRIATTPFPTIKIADMAIRGDRYYFLEADQTEVDEFTLNPSTNKLDRTGTHQLPAQADLIGWDGESLVAQLLEANKWVLVNGPGPITPSPTFSLRDHRFQVTDGPLRLEIPTRHEPIGIELLARDNQGTYYRVDDNYTKSNGEQIYRTYVYQFDTAGRFVHSYTLTEATDYKPSREIQIADGRIYQLLITRETAKVLLLKPN
jgi:hypothetical protein